MSTFDDEPFLIITSAGDIEVISDPKMKPGEIELHTRTPASELIIKAMTWGADRLNSCDRTIRESSRKESRDWAYGESVAIKAMLDILAGKDVPR